MSMILQAFMVLSCLALFIYIVRLVKSERLLLRYSLLWLALALVILLLALFPGITLSLSPVFGFATASNFVFLAGFLFLLFICLSLSSIVSRQMISIKNLVQRLALVEEELRDLEGRSPSAGRKGDDSK